MPEIDLFASIQQFVAETQRKIAAAKADGKLTLAEASQIAGESIRRLVSIAAEFNLPGADKKAAVMRGVDRLYDVLIAPLDIPYVPEPIESRIVDPMLKKFWLEIASGIVETFVGQLRKPTGSQPGD